MRPKPVLICLASGAAAAIVACGDDGGANKLPDAPTGGSDVMPDTPDPLTPARLTITNNGSGVEGVDVYFQNADNSLVAKVATNASGVAEAIVMPGAYVTVVNPFLVVVPLGGVRQDEIETIAGVQPGDQLVLSQNNGRQVPTNVTVQVAPEGGASQYRVWATCMEFDIKSNASMPYYLSTGSGGSGVEIFGNPDMLDCTQTDMLVETEDGSGGGISYLFKDNVPVTASATIDLTADAYVAMPNINIAYSDVPAAYSNLSVTNFLVNPDGAFWREQGSVGVGSGSASWNLQRPNPTGSTQVYLTDMFGGAGYGAHMILDWKPIADAPAISFANGLLRDFVGIPSFDITTAEVVWAEAATGAIADLAIAEVSGYREAPTMLSWRWRLAGVPTGATLKYPTLPTDIMQYNAVTGDTANVFSLSTAKVPGGYNTVRATVLSIEDPTVLVAGASGRVSIQQLAGRIVREAPRTTWSQATTRSR